MDVPSDKLTKQRASHLIRWTKNYRLDVDGVTTDHRSEDFPKEITGI